jgi:hypothetical protein
MTDEKFIKELGKILETFYNEVHDPLVKLVQEYKQGENSKSYESLWGYTEINRLDNLALPTAWIQDYLNNIQGYVGSPTYNKSRTKKIRKALGYNL